MELCCSVAREHVLTVFASSGGAKQNQPPAWSSKLAEFYALAREAGLDRLHERLGLDSCRHFLSGAAPIAHSTLGFFYALGMPLVEVYGLSETSGVHCLGDERDYRVGSAGKTDSTNRSRIHRQNPAAAAAAAVAAVESGADAGGELVVNGRQVFMGYLNDEARTRTTFTATGWLRTGDLARIEADDELGGGSGHIFITGRLKEIIVTAGGENVAPVPIEERIKRELPQLVSNCMVVGDKRKYLTVLLTLKVSLSDDGIL